MLIGPPRGLHLRVGPGQAEPAREEVLPREEDGPGDGEEAEGQRHGQGRRHVVRQAREDRVPLR